VILIRKQSGTDSQHIQRRFKVFTLGSAQCRPYRLKLKIFGRTGRDLLPNLNGSTQGLLSSKFSLGCADTKEIFGQGIGVGLLLGGRGLTSTSWSWAREGEESSPCFQVEIFKAGSI
jgi:hypothetical protein